MKSQIEFSITSLPPELQEKCSPRTKKILQIVSSQDLRSLKPDEMLEFLLGYGEFRPDLPQISRRLLRAMGGSLKQVLRAAPQELMQVEGVDVHMAEWIGELHKSMNVIKDMILSGMGPSMNYIRTERHVRSLYKQLRHPSNVILCLDEYSHFMYQQLLDIKNNWYDLPGVYTIVQEAISSNAAGIILVSTTPELVYLPSANERKVLHDLSITLHGANVSLLDFFFVGSRSISSMRRQNQIPAPPPKKHIQKINTIYMEEIPHESL